MSEKKEFEIKNPFTARLTVEELQIFQESLIDIVPDVEPDDLNNRRLLVRLIELSISKGKKIFIARPEDTEKIQELTNEIGRLKILIDQKDEELQRVNELYSQSKELSISLEDELSKKTDEVENTKTAIPAAGSLVLQFPEKGQKLLSVACQRLSTLKKQDITPDLFLWGLFWAYVKQESELPFPYLIRHSDIEKPAKQ